MPEKKHIEPCIYSSGELTGDFCSRCGHAKNLRRIDGKYILSEIQSVINFDKGIFYTVRELLVRPGESIRAFIHTDRNRLVKPVVFIVVCSFVYTVLLQLSNFEDGYVNYSFDENSTSTAIFEWCTNNYGYTNLLLSIFIALWIRILFRKGHYNYFEVLILLCFIMGIGMLLFSFFGIIDSLISVKIADKGFFFGVLYIAWGIGQFFEGNKIVNSMKGFLSYMLGIMTFTILMLIIGAGIDRVIT